MGTARSAGPRARSRHLSPSAGRAEVHTRGHVFAWASALTCVGRCLQVRSVRRELGVGSTSWETATPGGRECEEKKWYWGGNTIKTSYHTVFQSACPRSRPHPQRVRVPGPPLLDGSHSHRGVIAIFLCSSLMTPRVKLLFSALIHRLSEGHQRAWVVAQNGVTNCRCMPLLTGRVPLLTGWAPLSKASLLENRGRFLCRFKAGSPPGPRPGLSSLRRPCILLFP